MDFVNHTPFPAQDFGGVDQYDQHFYVIALRQTLTWGEAGNLMYADEQLPLCEEDQFAGDSQVGFVLQESDYCQYKPKCDVIINATAHVPGSRAARRFRVGLVVRKPDVPLPPPPRPHGLNQFVEPSASQLSEWEEQIRAGRVLPGERLLSKELDVCGERHFVRRSLPLRIATTAVQLATFTLLRPQAWRLTRPLPTSAVPVHMGRAFGGQARIEANDPAAKRVARRHRIPMPDVATTEGDRPIACDACDVNPAGRGYSRQWLVDAKRLRSVPAPQLSRPGHPLKVADFALALRGKLHSKRAAELSAGLGIRPKS